MKKFLFALCAFLCVMLFACDDLPSETTGGQSVVFGSVACGVTNTQLPVGEADFARLYQARGFYSDHNHLGRDIALPEGAPIRAIGCGTVRVYRSASGYGTLVAVVEHRLPYTLTVQNGAGESVRITNFLSIYGHIRPSSLPDGMGTRTGLASDMTVQAGTILGYIENQADNGDGAEHLHFGIRLQSATDASTIDPNAWFRGYDGLPSMVRSFADPALFMMSLMGHSLPQPDAGFSVPDAMFVSSLPDASVVMPVPDAAHCPHVPEDCNGIDDDCDGVVDNGLGTFTCGVGACRRTVPACVGGSWNRCFAGAGSSEICGNGVDEDCDGADLDCPVDAGSIGSDAARSSMTPTRYEFMVDPSAGWGASEPYRLRDLYWANQTCVNTGTTSLQVMSDGYHRCDLSNRLDPFVGSFFSSVHSDWGDRGNLGTVGTSPDRCTATEGVLWRITDLVTGRVLYQGSSAGLPCLHVGSQDRHGLPPGT